VGEEMVDSLSKLVGVFIAVILLFVFPIFQMADNQEETTKVYILTATTKFVDSVRDKGYIDQEMYGRYLDEIAVTGSNYTVSMEHMHKFYYPIYTDMADMTSFTEDFEMMYEGYFTEDIENELNSTGIYYLSKDDYFIVETYNKTATFATKVKRFVFGSSLDSMSIYVKFGGQVRYENY